MLVARILSVLLHPIFAPLISVFLLFNLPIYLNYKFTATYFNAVYGALTVNLVLAPIAISWFFKKKGIISSLEMPTAKERVLPYLTSSFFYIFTFFLLQKIQFPLLYLAVFKGATVVVILLLFLALIKLKVSAHLAGIGGIVGMLILVSQTVQIDIFLPLVIFILIAGMLGTARLLLKAHSFSELFAGFSLGLISQLIFLL